MGTAEAFDSVRRAVAADPHKRLVSERYCEDMFGNFIVAFEENGQPKSIVNDRFELVVCTDLDGEHGCRTALPSLREADEATIPRALQL